MAKKTAYSMLQKIIKSEKALSGSQKKEFDTKLKQLLTRFASRRAAWAKQHAANQAIKAKVARNCRG